MVNLAEPLCDCENPVGQCLQLSSDCSPTVSKYLPGPHSRQSACLLEADVLEYLPVLQFLHNASKNASYYKNSNIYIPKVAEKTTFNSRKSNIKEQQASKRPTTPTIRTPEQIAAAEERSFYIICTVPCLKKGHVKANVTLVN